MDRRTLRRAAYRPAAPQREPVRVSIGLAISLGIALLVAVPLGVVIFLNIEANRANTYALLNDRAALLYGVSTLHCMTQSLAAGGEGLGAAWGRHLAEDYAHRAGFNTFLPLEDITNKFSAFYLLTV